MEIRPHFSSLFLLLKGHFFAIQNPCFLKKIITIFRFHAEFTWDFRAGFEKCVNNYGNVPGIVPGKASKIS
jgi:hypothetical protein